MAASTRELQEDKKVKDRIDSRNGLEGYCYNLKNMLEDDEKGLADKLTAEEKETIEKAVQETLDWVDENQEAEAEDFKDKQKEIGALFVSCLSTHKNPSRKPLCPPFLPPMTKR
jgi:molecular chaperone DnaK (HSP70)